MVYTLALASTEMAESIVEIRQKRVVLGITGGIAAYKAAELVRLLIKDGIEVQVVMTEAACGFITPVTMQALSGKPVFTDMWDARVADNMAHIELSRGADAIVVVPATTDFLAKLANGLADDLLSTLCVARECPLLVAPAMNRQMWENKALFSHICRFIAGATSSGHSRATHRVESRSSARPLASLARKSVVAGTTTMASAPRDNSICAMLSATRASHMSVKTGLPESACMVTGVMKPHAASVMTTCTSMPSLMSRRTSSAAL